MPTECIAEQFDFGTGEGRAVEAGFDAGLLRATDRAAATMRANDRPGFGDRGQIGDRVMARAKRKSGVKEVPPSEIEDDLSRYLREAEAQEIVITRHARPAGVLIGFETEDDWFDYRLENDPIFLRRIERARNSLRAGRGIKLEDFERD